MAFLMMRTAREEGDGKTTCLQLCILIKFLQRARVKGLLMLQEAGETSYA